ncbi:MAG: EamA family transporter [Thermodesulfobacteriota bacterium]
MERWYLLTLLALVLFSLGSFLGKVASLNDMPYRVYFFEGVGTLTVFTTFVIYNRNNIFNNFSMNFPGLLMGLSWGIGTVLFIVALKYAKLSVLVPLSAVYPALTVVLALIFLGERLGPREIAGVVLAIVSAALLAK